MRHCFAAAFLTASGDLDVGAVEKETVDTAVALLKARPDIGMLLFECSELPPYAPAVQRATGIPVFDFASMVEFVIAKCVATHRNCLILRFARSVGGPTRSDSWPEHAKAGQMKWWITCCVIYPDGRPEE